MQPYACAACVQVYARLGVKAKFRSQVPTECVRFMYFSNVCIYVFYIYIYIYTHLSLFVNSLQLDVYMHTCICYEWQHLFCAFRATPCFHSPLSEKSYDGSVHKLEECISASDSATQPVDCASLADLGEQVQIRCIYAHMYLLQYVHFIKKWLNNRKTTPA